MTPTECVDLVEFIAGRCPAMRMQPNTPETWYVDLVGFDLTDAIEAARTVTLAKTFIGIGDLVAECEAILQRRAGRERAAELERQIAAENPPAELRSHPVSALTVGQSIPAPDYERGRRAKELAAAVAAAKAPKDQP